MNPNSCLSALRLTSRLGIRNLSSDVKSCKLLVLGGGAGGCSVAAKFTSLLGKDRVVVVDPADVHYYQPMFTLVGGGIKKLPQSSRSMSSVLPKEADWVQESVTGIDPKSSLVTTKSGLKIKYDFLVIALGIDLRYDLVPGLERALELPDSGVCSNYSPKYVNRTFETLNQIKDGNAIFTFPNTPVKCAGAPLKACLISEHFFSKEGKRANVKVFYRTSLPAIFSVKHYAEKLLALCKNRNIDVGLRHELIDVDYKNKVATFKLLDNPSQNVKMNYSMLHVTPPMTSPSILKSNKDLVDDNGFLKVNRNTLQHDNFKNIFGIGDCTNLPTSKTAAAVAAQSGVLFSNLSNEMGLSARKAQYNGYTSCPLVTGYGSCILAEFDYNLQPLETFPIDQSKEHLSMYVMKKDMMPFLYWNAMLKGWWNGPEPLRKIMHLGMT